MKNTPPVAGKLNHEQLDGRACVVCGKNSRPMVPIGLETSISSEVFRCDRSECAVDPAEVLRWINASDPGASPHELTKPHPVLSGYSKIEWLSYCANAKIGMDTELAILGIAETALHELTAALVRQSDIKEIKAACEKSVYWPKFCEAVNAGVVPASWIPGAIGQVVLGWARGRE